MGATRPFRPEREAVARAGQRDLTTGPIGSTLLAFALPTLGSNVLQSLNGSINTIWVGRFLGEGALAATSNANIIMFLMFSAVFGFGMAATILVGQSIRPARYRRRRGARSDRRSASWCGGAIVIAALGWIFAPDILQLLATPGDAMQLALDLSPGHLSRPARSMLLVLLIRWACAASGDSLTPLWFMALSVVLDSSLNPVFIIGLGPFPAMGIAGSAVATLFANAIAVDRTDRLRLSARPADPSARA